MDIYNTLKKLDLILPDPSNPGGNYVSVNVRSNVAYVAIQFPIRNEAYFFQGALGNELTTDDGYQAMQLCALNVLAQINKYFPWDEVEGLNHIDAYYQSVKGWDDAPLVVNGASDTFVNVLGEKGKHSRSIIGVHALPRRFSVGLTSSFTLKK